MSSDLYKNFKKKVIRYDLFSSFCYTNCLPNTKLDIFVLISKSLSGSIIANISLLIILYLIWSKVSCQDWNHLQLPQHYRTAAGTTCNDRRTAANRRTSFPTKIATFCYARHFRHIRSRVTITVSAARVWACGGRCVGVGATLVQCRVCQGKQWTGFSALGLQWSVKCMSWLLSI